MQKEDISTTVMKLRELSAKPDLSHEQKQRVQRTLTVYSRAHRYAMAMGVLFLHAGIGKKAPRGQTNELVQVTRGARYISLSVQLADPTDLEKAVKLADKIALSTATPVVMARVLPKSPGCVTYQFQLGSGLWDTYYRGVDAKGAVVALAEQRQGVEFRFSDAPHSLIAGITTAGKSTAMISILCSLAEEHSPADLKLAIVDPDGDYTAFAHSQHLAGAIAHRPGDWQRAITFASAELSRRMAAGQRGDDTPYRLVVVIDEATSVLDPKVTDLLSHVQLLAARGAKRRVNLIVLTQRMDAAVIPQLRHLLGQRWVGLVENAGLSQHLIGQAGLGCHQLTGAGEFMKRIPTGVTRCQFALSRDADLDALPHVSEPPEFPSPGDVSNLPAVIDHDDILPVPVSKAVGRPSVAYDPEAIAHYAVGKVSRAYAEKVLGFRRHTHEKHAEFARVMAAKARALIAERKEQRRLS